MTTQRTIRLDVHQDWDMDLVAAGLEQVDGWGERALFAGTLAQWRAAWDRIESTTRHYTRSDKRRRTAVLSRIGNNISARLHVRR